MANFTKDDLLYQYNWHADGGDNPNYKGLSDRVKVDKTEGYEVFYFCNKYFTLYDVRPTLENFRRVEKLLKNSGASHIVIRDELYRFVDENW